MITLKRLRLKFGLMTMYLCVSSGALWEDYRHRVNVDWLCGSQEELRPESDSPLASWAFPAHGMEEQGMP